MLLLTLADGANAAAGIMAGGFFLFFLVFVAIASIFWIWTLIKCILNPALTDGDRIVWVLLIVFMHFIGSILYYCLAPSSKSPPRIG